MDIVNLLNDKNVKSIEKREKTAELLNNKLLEIKEVQRLREVLDDKKMAPILEAMEAVTGKNPETADLNWLKLAQDFIPSKSNALKREASRIVGNIAFLFPNELEASVKALFANTNDESVVVRWGSAYALGRIVCIPQFANGALYETVLDLYEKENENGVKNQFLKGLKKADKIRRG